MSSTTASEAQAFSALTSTVLEAMEAMGPIAPKHFSRAFRGTYGKVHEGATPSGKGANIKKARENLTTQFSAYSKAFKNYVADTTDVEINPVTVAELEAACQGEALSESENILESLAFTHADLKTEYTKLVSYANTWMCSVDIMRFNMEYAK